MPHASTHPPIMDVMGLLRVQRFGKGTWIDRDGSRYDGKWVKGRKEGSGVMTYSNGSKFSGNWQRGRRHGKGVFTTPDESTKYVGDWANDIREGKGILTDPTGVYNGDWANDAVLTPFCLPLSSVLCCLYLMTMVNAAQRAGYIYIRQWKDLLGRMEE